MDLEQQAKMLQLSKGEMIHGDLHLSAGRREEKRWIEEIQEVNMRLLVVNWMQGVGEELDQR